tara:strand:+ start:161 stop:1033 length:873 start_codon:yes stop_codon:yes gene_type:complete
MINSTVRRLWICGLMGLPAWSFAIDIPPGQAIAPPPGKSAIRFEMNSVNFGEKYSDGDALNTDSELTLNSLGVQYSRSLMIKNRLAGFYLNSAVGRARPGGAIAGQGIVTGATDSAAALVTWLYADKEKGRYAVLGTFVIAPTGDYDSNRAVNLGQNRFAGGFQLGYHTRLARDWDVMTTANVMFSGKNEDYRLTHQTYEQDPLYSMQFTTMHHIDPSLTLSGTYYIYHGGAGHLDGVAMDDDISRNRYEVVVSKRVRSAKYFLYFGKDASTENGFIEDRRLSLRYQYYF